MKPNRITSAGTAADSEPNMKLQRPAKLLPNPMLSAALSFSEFGKVSHALGIDLFKAVMSLKLKDKRLPKTFYRNYYNASQRQAENEGINLLVEKGIMKQIQPEYYSVTEIGIEQFRKQFSELAIYKSKGERDTDYLRHRINFYCSFYNYNFCNNNSDHVIEYAPKYLIEKEYVSHTTKDVINRFKTELKALLKKQSVF